VPSADLQKEARRLLKRFGCGYLGRGVWGPLSQGEKAKVLICRALMAEYEILILDEPCAGLDPVAREVFLRWLQKVAVGPGGPSVILVTHHVEEILPCTTHALVLKEGTVAAAGELDEVLTDEVLTAAFGAKVRVWKDEERRYRLSVKP
jgi:iron complex transport system ATP-binding protein